MSKPLLFLFIILCSILAASLFGIVHDQVTYSLSSEYYTKFKFYQFRLAEPGTDININHRIAAVIIGIKATWWTGLIIGLFYAIILMTFRDTEKIPRLYLKSLRLTFIITIIGSVMGYFYWRFNLQDAEVDWYLP